MSIGAASPIGYVLGPIAAGVVGSLALSYAGKKVAEKIYDKRNIKKTRDWNREKSRYFRKTS